MKHRVLGLPCFLVFLCCSAFLSARAAGETNEKLFWHPVRLDKQGKLLSWWPGDSPCGDVVCRAWAPTRENHLLRSTSVVRRIKYGKDRIVYATFDAAAGTRCRSGPPRLDSIGPTATLSNRSRAAAPR